MDMVKLLLNANVISYDRGDTGYDGAIRRAEDGRHLAIADMIRQQRLDNERWGISNPYLSDPPRTWHEYIPAWTAIGEYPASNENPTDSARQNEASFEDMTPGPSTVYGRTPSTTADISVGRAYVDQSSEKPSQANDSGSVIFAPVHPPVGQASNQRTTGP